VRRITALGRCGVGSHIKLIDSDEDYLNNLNKHSPMMDDFNTHNSSGIKYGKRSKWVDDEWTYGTASEKLVWELMNWSKDTERADLAEINTLRKKLEEARRKNSNIRAKLTRLQKRNEQEPDERLREIARVEKELDELGLKLGKREEELKAETEASKKEIDAANKELYERAKEAADKLEQDEAEMKAELEKEAQRIQNKLEDDYRNKVYDLECQREVDLAEMEFEKKRLAQVRAELADREAKLAFREQQVAKVEGLNHTVKNAGGNAPVRQIDI
jgi:DNA repair exonuclease SbcCD ATPase subunit